MVEAAVKRIKDFNSGGRKQQFIGVDYSGSSLEVSVNDIRTIAIKNRLVCSIIDFALNNYELFTRVDQGGWVTISLPLGPLANWSGIAEGTIVAELLALRKYKNIRFRVVV